MYSIYCHKKLGTSEIFYIGQADNTIRPYSRNHRNNWWHNIVNKHGFSVFILAENLSKENADNLEKWLIKEIGRRDKGLGPLVNLTDGGEGAIGRKVSDKTKEKISNSRMGKYAGDKNPRFGIHLSDETKKKISIAKQGYVFTKEQKINISAGLKNSKKFNSEETKLQRKNTHEKKKKECADKIQNYLKNHSNRETMQYFNLSKSAFFRYKKLKYE